ncbi:hypothetical protein LQE92_06345 [Lacrimispora sp. NSJ-141]|uniref:Uncharacterized protein n=1 Tax=Lientehia hominis TaxID=2897778 RepID=A0AAP2W9X5_9FIRM|nr:hypothetical protein [Lientehia hominis]MCD2492249.1 hypothetical protein [Lientehia hominis]
MTNEKHDAGAVACILAEQEKDSIGRYCLLCYNESDMSDETEPGSTGIHMNER